MKRAIIILILALSMMPIANAFGISYQFMQDNTLELYPGQEYLFKLTIQNKEEEITVKVNYDSPLVELLGDSILTIPANNTDTYVVLKISVPEDAALGEVYEIGYEVFPYEKGEGQVSLAIRYGRSFKVKVVEYQDADVQKPVEIPRKDWYKQIPKTPTIITIVVLVSLIMLLIWKKSSQVSTRILENKTATANPQFTKQEIVEDTVIPAAYQAPPEYEKSDEVKVELAKQIKVRKRIILSKEEYFYAKDGQIFKNLDELVEGLMQMSNSTFRKHVNEKNNDFANWIKYCFENEELASEVSKAKTPDEAIKAIQNAK